MSIPLNQFEQYIDRTILNRGLSYYTENRVRDLVEISPGIYEAVVEGSEDYSVRLTIKDKILTGYTCDCPYDMGPVCKHVVAAIYVLQQDQKENPVQVKSVTEQVEKLLENATHDELKQFIRELAIGTPSFRNLFLSSFAHCNSDESKGLYTRQIKALLQNASDNSGFINWSASREVGNAVNDLLESAQKQLHKQNYNSVLLMSTAIMEEMTPALQYADDSGGDIGMCIDLAFEILYQTAIEQQDGEIRQRILDYCFTAFEKKIYEGWDWHIGMLRIAAEAVTTAEEASRLLTLLDTVQGSSYEADRIHTIYYEILLKIKGEEEANAYLEHNISNPNMRRYAIANAMESRNYEKAIDIAKDGIKCDMKDKPGLVIEWHDWLLKIAQAQNNVEEIIVYARYLFIANFRHEQNYYEILKTHVKAEDWRAFIEDVINDIKAKNPWPAPGLLAKIYINENWWDRLLGLVKESPRLSHIENYENFLAENYGSELIDLYGKGILEYLTRNVGRKHYKVACRYIRRIIKLGGYEKAYQIINYLKKEYPNRRALMEELNHIELTQ